MQGRRALGGDRLSGRAIRRDTAARGAEFASVRKGERTSLSQLSPSDDARRFLGLMPAYALRILRENYEL